MATRKRDPYSVVGEAMRQAIAAAHAAPGLTKLDHKVLAAVLYLVGTWSRLRDDVYLGDIAAVTYGVEKDEAHGTAGKWMRDKVSVSLKRLHASGVIVFTPRRGQGVRSTITLLRKAPEQGGVNADEKAPETGSVKGGTKAPDFDGKGTQDRSEKAPEQGSPTEDCSEYSEREFSRTDIADAAARLVRNKPDEAKAVVDTLCVEHGDSRVADAVSKLAHKSFTWTSQLRTAIVSALPPRYKPLVIENVDEADVADGPSNVAAARELLRRTSA